MKTQEIEFSKASLERLERRLRSLDISRIMLFHGHNSWKGSPLVDVLTRIQDTTVRLVEYTDIPERPSLEGIQKAKDVYNRLEPTVIIACGGGSVIDLAKGVIAAQATENLADLKDNLFTIDSPPYFIAIPTTAGSGSEATHFAVIYDNGKKFSLANEGLLPDLVVLNPLFVKNCPLEVILASGADALCQAVESIWSRASTMRTQAFATESLNLLYPALLELSEDPGNLALWARIQKGAWLSGSAINMTKTTAGHALSYGLTIELGLPHGLAVLAIMRPLISCMETKYRFFKPGSPGQNDQRIAVLPRGSDFPSYFSEVANGIWSKLTSSNRNALSTRLAYDRLASSKRLELVETLTDNVNIQRLSNHPIELSRSDIKDIYIEALEFLAQ